MLGRPCRLVALAIVAAVSAPAAGATPCGDEPGFAGLACRVAGLAAMAGAAEPHVRRRVDALGARLAPAMDACARGSTQAARGGLRALRRRLDDVRRTLEDEVRRGRVSRGAAATLAGDLRLVDALRRATDARLARHPCPELVEILRPAEGEVIAETEGFVLLRLAAEADPTTLAVRLEGGASSRDVPLADASATQAWARVGCITPGPTALRVRVRDRDGAHRDEETVHVRCGGSGLVLGAEVEVLVDEDHGPATLRLTPVRPLRSGATYAVVISRGLRARRGGHVVASADFRAAVGTGGGRRGGARAYWATEAADPRNPFPSERLVRPDGTVTIPGGFTARALPATPRLDGVRAFLRSLDARSEEHHGFSPNTPVVLHFDAPLDLDSATPESVFLVEIARPGSGGSAGANLRALLDAVEQERGIRRDSVAVASIFPVEDVAGTMAAIRQQIVARAAAAPPAVDYTDPDPADARRFGVFRPGDPGFAAFFGGSPPATVGAVARGSFPSPEYRAEGGRFPARFIDGSAVPPYLPLEFLLAVPAVDVAAGIVPPFPTVILQHGFGGDDTFVTQLAGDLTAAGLAAIGIPAPEHGPRGNFLDFFNFDDFNAFGDNWRQASVDLFQLVRLVEAGVDLDGDGVSELDPDRLGYLGVSLGGVIGGVFTAVEPGVTAAVLNVAGGRLSQLSGADSPFAEPFLARFAVASGIPVRVCGEEPTDPPCRSDAECAGGGSCLRNPDFTLLLEAATLDFQTQLDPGDGAAYARWLRLEPRGVGPRAVLVQEGIGDTILANPLTEALARAIGLPANRADGAPRGVAGLWRYPPPAGHGILALPAVRAQAITFLRTGGRLLASP